MVPQLSALLITLVLTYFKKKSGVILINLDLNNVKIGLEIIFIIRVCFND